jgi:cold shock CspA family protein
VPINITFRDVEKTDALESLIREKAEKLEQVYENMNSCRVAVEKPHEHQRTGNPYRVRIEITVPPGHNVVVTKGGGDMDMHERLSAVIREAFSAARIQLKEMSEKQRMRVKKHPDQQVGGLVARIFKDEGYGFIESVHGEEIYFHENSVLQNDFDRLTVGTGVRYVVEEGEKGLQASTVQIVDKPGSRMSK